MAHSALKVRRNEPLAYGRHGDEELGCCRLSLVQFLHSWSFVTVHRQFLATLQNLDVADSEQLADAAIVLIRASGVECEVELHRKMLSVSSQS